jgi:nucleoid DNA-binding protein
MSTKKIVRSVSSPSARVPSNIRNLNDSLASDTIKMEMSKSKKQLDYREEYFMTNFGISMSQWFDQMKDCLQNNKAVSVKGFGFNSTNLGMLLDKEDKIDKITRERCPTFHQRLKLEKRFNR